MPKETTKELKKQPAKQYQKPNKPIDTSAALLGAGIAIVGMLLIGGATFAATSLARHNNQPQQMGINGKLGDGPGSMSGGMRGQRPTFGTVKTIDGRTLTVTTQDEDTITVTVDENTKYSQDRDEAELNNIKTGDTVVVFGKVSDNKVTAARVVINPDFTPPQQ